MNLNDINLDQIKHVPMHQYGISTKEKPLLLIENLQVCIGLYAYSKDFSFAAHLNPVVIRENEFKCDSNQNITYCNRIDDLFNIVTNAEIKEPLYLQREKEEKEFLEMLPKINQDEKQEFIEYKPIPDNDNNLKK